jgi:enamine deaminase RidA (YjgF/YER057c/UK114 family)
MGPDVDFEQQAQLVLNNPAAALADAGSAVDRLVQVRADMALWPAFDAIYAKWIGATRPSRAVVPVPELHYGFKIGVEATALA